MRILYGAFAQGHGHFSKASVLVPLLEHRGHQVRVVSSGGSQPPPGYDFRWHRHFPALSYVVKNGLIDYKKSSAKWAREFPRILGHLVKLRALVREFEPDLIISDFEPLTASPFLAPRCEVVSLCRQVALFDPQVPLPETLDLQRKLTRAVFRLFTAGADRCYGYHYMPASYRCVPPVVRSSIRNVVPEIGDHIVVYNHVNNVGTGSAESLISWASRNRQTIKAYGFPAADRGVCGFVEFCAQDPVQMPEDLRTSKGVATTAGLTTPLEAYLLGKPVLTVPIPQHWEQQVNAAHLEQAGIATARQDWDFDMLLKRPIQPIVTGVPSWLRTSPEQILDHVLCEFSDVAVDSGSRIAA
ncbi:MAG: glycosyltransferase [Planctomycetota bacterium]|nr:glycosyltransferase [Planctomycetota bacterium]